MIFFQRAEKNAVVKLKIRAAHNIVRVNMYMQKRGANSSIKSVHRVSAISTFRHLVTIAICTCSAFYFYTAGLNKNYYDIAVCCGLFVI